MSTDVTAITEMNVLWKTNVWLLELYTELMLLIAKLMNTNITMVSRTLHYENLKTSFRHRSHLTASDLSKYNWKFIDNGAVPTIKFSIAKHVKGNTFINNCNLYLSEKAFIIRNLDDINMLNINKQLLNRVNDDSNDLLRCVFVFTVCITYEIFLFL